VRQEVQKSCEECFDQTEPDPGWLTKVVDGGVVVCTRGEIEELRLSEEGHAVLVVTVLTGSYYPSLVLACLGRVVDVDLAHLPASRFGPFFAGPAYSVCTFLQKGVTLSYSIGQGLAKRGDVGEPPQEGRIGPKLQTIRC
jgi:hypothetical protein